MTNDELDKKLRSDRVPEPGLEYWTDFSGRLARRIAAGDRSEIITRPPPRLLPRLLAWSAVGALAGLILFLPAEKKPSAGSDQARQMENYFREISPLFPHQVRAIVLDAAGPRLVLSDKPDVAESSPVYMKICGKGRCQSVLTFSGQQVLVDTDWCDVLVNGRGEVIVVGRNLAWSSSAPDGSPESFHIEARQLSEQL